MIIAGIVLAALLIFFFRNGDYTEIDFLFFEKRTTKRWSIIVAVLLGVGARPAPQLLVGPTSQEQEQQLTSQPAGLGSGRLGGNDGPHAGCVIHGCERGGPRSRR